MRPSCPETGARLIWPEYLQGGQKRDLFRLWAGVPGSHTELAQFYFTNYVGGELARFREPDTFSKRRLTGIQIYNVNTFPDSDQLNAIYNKGELVLKDICGAVTRLPLSTIAQFGTQPMRGITHVDMWVDPYNSGIVFNTALTAGEKADTLNLNLIFE